jgi:hypothetical protein
MTKLKTETHLSENAVMRSFFVKNRKPTFYIVCFLGLIYVNTGLPFRIKRVDYGQTFYEVMY